jgi:2-polyprenyl-6-methoxyphenol hydroxylase-like FAD-dependent oxidoreductase
MRPTALSRPGASQGGRAVVVGASMGGLLAARVLSEAFDEVIVIDRDSLAGAGPRRGVPQGHQAHGILARGRSALEDLFPGFTAELTAAGAVPLDLHDDIAWFNGTRRISGAPSDLLILTVSRPFLEDYVRSRVRRLPNVRLRGGHAAAGLLASSDRRVVTGVQLSRVGAGADGPDGGREDLAADLVVDATGRSNRGLAWLAELGYEAPPEDRVHASIVYATRSYARRGPLPGGAAAVVSALSPASPYSAVLIPVEGDRWILTLIGIGRDIPPADADGFGEFARHLPLDDLHHVIRHAEPLDEPRRFRVPASVRRRYERLAARPDGYLAIADALCAFNPVYAQGMSVAAIEALALRDCLRESRDDLPRRFYARAAGLISVPWDMAAGGDLAVPTTAGKRTLKIRFLNAYVARVLRAAETDPRVSLAFHRTANLLSPPRRLFAPRMLARVLFGSPAPQSPAPQSPAPQSPATAGESRRRDAARQP